MNAKKIVYIDTVSTDAFHEMFNATFLYVLLNNTEGPLIYIADKTVIESLTKTLADDKKFIQLLDRIRFQHLNLLKGNRFYHIFLRFFFGAVLNIFYLVKHRSKIVFFSQLNPVSAFFIRSILYMQKTRVYIVCHGELSFCEVKSNWKQPVFWYGLFLKPFLNSSLPGGLKLIVLGESILRNIKISFPRVHKQCIVMNHPFIFSKKTNTNIRINHSEKLNFGWVGVVTLSKGFDRFCALSSYFSEKGEDRFVSVVVGRHGLDPENYPKVNFVAKKNTYLSRKEFNEGVEKLDFILFFYDNEQYRLTASGAIFDAIEHEKVIIAIRNDYFEEIFQKCGDLGFLCKDDTEVFEIVNKILGNELDYSHVYENIRRAKEIYDYRNQIILL